MEKKLFYLQNANCNPENGYLISFGKCMWAWGKLENALKFTEKQVKSFVKKYEGGDPIFSVEVD